jgi:hypothetical protein
VATFGVATRTTADRPPTVDTDDLRDQLKQIRNSLDPLLSDPGAGLSLDSVDIGLTLSASGKVLFIGETGVEASITLTFTRGQASEPQDRNG